MTFYSTTQDCLRGISAALLAKLHQRNAATAPCLAAEQEAQLQVEIPRRRAADNARRLSEKTAPHKGGGRRAERV